MLNLVVRWVLLALSLILVAWMVPGIKIAGIGAALFAAIIIGVVNTFLRPIVMFLSIPINILTLGLFTFVINAFLLWFVAAVVPGFIISGFLTALVGSLLLSILSIVINRASGEFQTVS